MQGKVDRMQSTMDQSLTSFLIILLGFVLDLLYRDRMLLLLLLLLLLQFLLRQVQAGATDRRRRLSSSQRECFGVECV